MLLIPCPWCGPRNEMEFAYGHEGHIARPPEPEAISDAQWGDYLFMRKNPKGVMYERWVHARGCRRWFNVARHTVTHEILAVYKMGDPEPDLPTASGKGA
jgi:heterotetrameric sarcosine oxidase delta subunit